MAFSLGVGGGSSSALPHGPGVGQADVPMADASPAPVAAAQQSALALSDPSVALPEDGPGPEVRSGTRTQAPRLARTAASHRPTLVLSQGQAVLVAVAADGPNPAVALPDTPSGSGIEVQAQLVICPWAECLRPDDRPVLDAAWKYLGAFDQEQVAYALLRLLKDSDVSDKPRFDRVRTGALAVLSATYRRLQAGEALRAPPAEEDAVDEEQDLERPQLPRPLSRPDRCIASREGPRCGRGRRAARREDPEEYSGRLAEQDRPPRESRPPAFTAQRVVPSPTVRAPPIVASLRVSPLSR